MKRFTLSFAALGAAALAPLASAHIASELPTGEAARAEAVRIAGQDDLDKAALALCDPHPDRQAIDRLSDLENRKVFDDLYFAGTKNVSSWIWRSKTGYVIIDTLDDEKEAQEHIVASLDRFKIDRGAVKLIVITHGHRDHSGGAAYLKSILPNARLAMTREAQEVAVEGARRLGASFPTVDIVLRDGMHIADDLRVFETPGHSPGTVSLIFPLHAGNRHYMAGLLGGSASYSLSASDKAAYSRSAHRFGDLAARSNVDIILSNHPVLDQTRTWLESGVLPPRAAARTPAEVRTYYRIVDLCARSHM